MYQLRDLDRRPIDDLPIANRSVREGTFIVGTDIGAGTWSEPGGTGCYWARPSGFSGYVSDIILNDFGTISPVVTIFDSTLGLDLTVAGCGQGRKARRRPTEHLATKVA
jgi:hypothetical protein